MYSVLQCLQSLFNPSHSCIGSTVTNFVEHGTILIERLVVFSNQQIVSIDQLVVLLGGIEQPTPCGLASTQYLVRFSNCRERFVIIGRRRKHQNL